MPERAPVLITAFNRPEKVATLIDALRCTQPPVIVAAVDGPRVDVPEDLALVSRCIEAFQSIDWTDQVELWTSPTNLGLKTSVSSAVSRALDMYSSIIVLEDDLVPGSDALEFLWASLERYADAQEVGHISAYNSVPTPRIADSSAAARLSIYPSSWGWATWSRAWKCFRGDMENWRDWLGPERLRTTVVRRSAARYWISGFDHLAKEPVDSWAIPWTASLWSKGLLSLVSNQNLVAYGGWWSGTHTRGAPVYPEEPVTAFRGSLLGVDSMIVDAGADRWFESHVLRTGPIASGRRSISVWRDRRRLARDRLRIGKTQSPSSNKGDLP